MVVDFQGLKWFLDSYADDVHILCTALATSNDDNVSCRE